jgi:hypothetical protein
VVASRCHQRWDNDALRARKAFPGKDFEVVDAARLMVGVGFRTARRFPRAALGCWPGREAGHDTGSVARYGPTRGVLAAVVLSVVNWSTVSHHAAAPHPARTPHAGRKHRDGNGRKELPDVVQ